MRGPTTSRSTRAIFHGLSNVLLGVAVGLISYYFITDLLTRYEQGRLADEFPTAQTARAATKPVFDWEGWEAEDRAYWESLKEGEAFGRLVAPDMKLDAMVVKGTTRKALMKGPGWITWSDLPGPTGNCGISGHRTTYGAPFRRLDLLGEGDTIFLYSRFRVYEYRVQRVFTVTPDRGDVVSTTKEPTLTLTACHPPYSARLRLIVSGKLVSVQRLPR